VTGEFVAGVPFVKETWAKGLDEKGRPIVLPNTEPTPEGSLVHPDGHGGTSSESNLVTYEMGGKRCLVGASGNCFVAFDLP